MLTEDELAARVASQLRRELDGIAPPADLATSLGRRQARRSLAVRSGVAAVPVTAAAVAVAVAVATAGSPGRETPGPARSAVLTSAMVRQVATASQAAMARSGRAAISYRQWVNGSLTVTGADAITYSGRNWNDVFSQTFPAAAGSPATTQTAVNRIVNGQFYLGETGSGQRLQWIRQTGSSGHPGSQVPDPRSVLALLRPAGRFTVIGHRTVGGVRLTGLRAAEPGRLASVPGLLRQGPGKLARLTVWVTARNVVRQMTLQNRQARVLSNVAISKSRRGLIVVEAPTKRELEKARTSATYRKLGARQHVVYRVNTSLPDAVRHQTTLTSVTVTFTGIGTPQVITVPPNVSSAAGRG